MTYNNLSLLFRGKYRADIGPKGGVGFAVYTYKLQVYNDTGIQWTGQKTKKIKQKQIKTKKMKFRRRRGWKLRCSSR